MRRALKFDSSLQVVLNTFGFPFPNVLMLVQLTFTVIGLEIFRWQNWIDIPSYNLERYHITVAIFI